MSVWRKRTSTVIYTAEINYQAEIRSNFWPSEPEVISLGITRLYMEMTCKAERNDISAARSPLFTQHSQVVGSAAPCEKASTERRAPISFIRSLDWRSRSGIDNLLLIASLMPHGDALWRLRLRMCSLRVVSIVYARRQLMETTWIHRRNQQRVLEAITRRSHSDLSIGHAIEFRPGTFD